MESNYIINLDYGDFKYSHYELLVENGEFELTSSLNGSLHISATSLEEFQDSWVKNVKEAFPLLHNWIEVTSGEPLSKYLDKKVSACDVIKVDSDEEAEEIKSEPESFKVVTKHTDAVTYETELPDLSLSDKTLRKQAEYVADAVSKKFEENNKKQKNTNSDNKNEVTAKESNPYTLDNFKKDIQAVDADLLKMLLHIKKALILISPPGTGKTVTAKALAKYITGDTDSDRVKFVSFNQETSYTDIIGGYRNMAEDGEQNWQVEKGSFTKLCEKAVEDHSNTYIYIIDEINRANTERVLGEGLTAIAGRGVPVQTNNGFMLTVPENLYIIATMNSMDASVASLDTAMLDRFMIFNMPEIKVDVNKLKAPEELHNKIKVVINKLEEINKKLELDPYKKKDNRIGNRALYSKFDTLEELRAIVEYDIIPKVEIKISSLSDNDENKKAVKDLIKSLRDSLKDEKHEE